MLLLPSRCQHSSHIAATAAMLPPSHCRHSSRGAAAVLLPQQQQCHHCIVATIAMTPKSRCCHISRVTANHLPPLDNKCVDAEIFCLCMRRCDHDHLPPPSSLLSMTIVLQQRHCSCLSVSIIVFSPPSSGQASSAAQMTTAEHAMYRANLASKCPQINGKYKPPTVMH